MWVCEKYFKTYKTKIGLVRHHNAKHLVTEISNTEPTPCSTSTPIDEEVQEDLSVDELFTLNFVM